MSALFLNNPATCGPDNSARWGYVVSTSDFTDAQVEKYLSGYNSLCVTGYRLTEKGGIVKNESALTRKIKSSVKNTGVALYPLVSFNSVKTGKLILSDPALSAAAVKALVSLADDAAFAGVHLDFEYLPPAYAARLAVFLSAVKPRMKNKKLTMALFPQIVFPTDWAGFHDYEKIAPYIDAAVIMCYDLNRTSTRPGPVTSIDWSDKNITAALKYIPGEKIYLGIPAYGYYWPAVQKPHAVSAARASRMSSMGRFSRDDSGCARIDMADGGVIYYSDVFTREQLTSLAARRGLKGTAVWRLGFEE